MFDIYTPPKLNIAWWLEDYFPIGKLKFQGQTVKLPGCKWKFLGSDLQKSPPWLRLTIAALHVSLQPRLAPPQTSKVGQVSHRAFLVFPFFLGGGGVVFHFIRYNHHPRDFLRGGKHLCCVVSKVISSASVMLIEWNATPPSIKPHKACFSPNFKKLSHRHLKVIP